MPFFISVFIHISILGILLWTWEKPVKPAPKITSISYVELKEPSKKKEPKGKKQASSSGRGQKLTSSSFSLNTVEDLARANRAKTYNHGDNDMSLPDNSHAIWGQGGHEFGRLKDYIKIEGAARRVQGLVHYPPALSYRKIGGVVRSRLVIDKLGKCDWNTSRIMGTRQELRLYTLSVLKNFCKNFRWRGNNKRKSSNIDFSLNFDVYSKEEPSVTINGNVILMELPGKQDRGTWKLGPIQGHFLFPPMIFMNPQWITENWNRLVKKEDPLAEFKKEQRR